MDAAASFKLPQLYQAVPVYLRSRVDKRTAPSVLRAAVEKKLMRLAAHCFKHIILHLHDYFCRPSESNPAPEVVEEAISVYLKAIFHSR
jgi:hypothetical protein